MKHIAGNFDIYKSETLTNNSRTEDDHIIEAVKS